MLQPRARLSCPRRSIHFTSRLLTDGQPTKMMATTPGAAESPSSILSRLSHRIRSNTRRSSDTEQKSPNPHVQVATVSHRKPHARATSFISTRSAQKRDHAAEKWFTDVRELDIDNVDQSSDLKSLPRKKRVGPPKQHEMRPPTDLNTLFAPPITARSATSSRLRAKKELGGDYTSYLPDGYADPYQLPVDYARLVLGRNKYISLDAQAGALNIIERSIGGRTTRQFG